MQQDSLAQVVMKPKIDPGYNWTLWDKLWFVGLAVIFLTNNCNLKII